MNALEINVTEIEELQTLQYTTELDKLFAKAQSTIVNGEIVILVRKDAEGKAQKFDEITTLEDLNAYKKNVYKYL